MLDFLKIDTLMAETAPIKDELKRAVEAALEGQGRRADRGARIVAAPLQKPRRNNRWCRQSCPPIRTKNQDRPMNEAPDAARLTDQVAALVEAAKKAGADAADAVAVRGRSTSVSVRLGKVESTECFRRRRRFAAGLRRQARRQRVGDRLPPIRRRSPSARSRWRRFRPRIPIRASPTPALLAKTVRDLDLFDPTVVTADELRESALAAEEAALAVPGVTNSSGSGASAGLGGLVLATSHGFVGHYVGSRFGRSASVIAGEGTGMERDYEYSSRQHFADLDSAEEIGRKAGERAVRRLNARKAKTGPVDVVFDPRVARGIAGHLAGAINGASVARKTSFLRDMMGKQVASAGDHRHATSRRGCAARPRGPSTARASRARSC